jgi:uncharacterized protein YcsI (UPF0317 family)
MAEPAREIERDQNLLTGLAARLACRRGNLGATTAGIAPGYVQGNLAVLPQNLAADFLRFCQANPKPCPLIGVSDVGNPHIPALGLDLDIRTDLPGYRVWQDGELVEETADVTKWWREDLVSFVIGCSYSFEESLIEDGIPLRHVEQRLRVPMYRTNINCTPASAFFWPDGGVDAAAATAACHPRDPDHLPVSGGAWCACPHRLAGAHRHQGSRQA